MSLWPTVGLAGGWYGLAVCNQLLAANLDLDYFLIPWSVLASSLLVYGLSWLHPLLPRAWKFTPASPVPRQRTRTVQQHCDEPSGSSGGNSSNDTETGAAGGDSGQLEGETVALLSAYVEPVSCGPNQAEQWSGLGPASLGALLDGGTMDQVELWAAAMLHVFYHCSSLFVGLWIGDSSIVLIWRSLEPLLLHIIHHRQLTAPDALQGAMLLYLLARWDRPTDSELSTWLLQRGLVVLGSAALCCCNHILHSRTQSGEVGRSFFQRVAGYSLLLSLLLWLVSLPVVPVESLLNAAGFAFPLLSLSTAMYIFVGWLLLTHCSLELYSLLLMAKRGVVVNGVYLMYIWRQLQAVLIVASVTLSSLIECSKVSSQRRWSLLPLVLVCLTAFVQRAVELPHSYAGLPILPLSMPTRHIAVITAAGNGNLGDNVQLDAWRSHLDSWTERTGIAVVLHSWSRELCCTSYDETLKHYLPSDAASLTRLLKETPPLDWIWIGGGGLLSCAHPPLNDNDPTWQYHLLQRAELSRTRVAFMGLGASVPRLVKTVHPLLEAAAYIGVRDLQSVEVVATHVNRSAIAIMHDPVLAMQPFIPPPHREAARVPVCWILMGAWTANPTINMLVDAYHQPGEDLLLTLEQKDGNFYGRFNPDFVRLHDRDLRAFSLSLSHCDFVVSMRFHGAIIASVLGIPSLGLDMAANATTTGKMTALYSPLELDRPDCVLYPNIHANMSFVDVKAAVNRCRRHMGAKEQLQRRMTAIRAEFQTQFDRVMGM